MLDDKQALELATALLQRVSEENQAVLEQARERGDVRESFAEDLSEAKAAFLREGPKSPALFDIAVTHLLEKGAPADTLAASAALHAGAPSSQMGDGQALWAQIKRAVRLVTLQAEQVDDAQVVFRAHLLECPSVNAQVFVCPDRSRQDPSVSLNGELPGEWVVTARLRPQTSRFSLRRFGELEIGDKSVDDAYIIDAKPGATPLLRHLRGPLLRLAEYCEQLEFAPTSVAFHLEKLPTSAPQLAEVVDAALDLWAASVTWCLNLSQEAASEED